MCKKWNESFPFSLHYLFSFSLYLQSEYKNLRTPLEIGNDVTTSKPNGDVVLQPGANIFISKGNGITIKNGFECKIGASFTVE